MGAPGLVLALALTLVPAVPAFAQPARLAVGAPPTAGRLPVGASESFALELHAGDFVTGAVEQHGVGVRLDLVDPSGRRLRGWSGFNQGRMRFAFVAQSAGAYRLTASARQSRPAAFEIAISGVTPLPIPAPPAVAAPDSPRLKALQTAVAAGKADLPAFWAGVTKEGTPLVEPVDAKSDRVTFLWRGDAGTRDVQLLWALPPFGPHPLQRIGGTDVWYRSEVLAKGARFTYQLAPDAPALPGGTSAVARTDPLNPRTFGDIEDTDVFALSSLTELPGAAPQPWAEPRPGVPAARVERRRFKSAILGNEREIAVVLPTGFDPHAGPYDLLVLFDEEAYLDRVPTPVILANLTAAGRIAPTVAVVIGNVSEESRGRELAGNPDFARFVAEEVLPWARAGYAVAQDPSRVTVGGSSYGGLAAGYVAFRYPRAFGKVLAQSGSFWWSPTRDPSRPEAFDPNSEPTWMVRQFAASPKLPLKFYLDAGWYEGGEGGGILDTSRFLRDVLRAKGYEVTYAEFIGGHDYVNWRGTLADGLIALSGKP
jgi:enterochelin esterase family protein